MGIHPVQENQPIVNIRGGFLRSLENNVAIVRGLGFETHIKIFQPLSRHHQMPLTILVENVRGHEVEITQHGGFLHNIMRSNTSVIFDIKGSTVQKIRLSYPYQVEEFDFLFFGDTHGVFHNLQRIIETANILEPLFIMSNGDMTHSGRLEEYHTLTDILGQSNVPVFTSIGNHDKRARGSRVTYRKMLAPFYYSFSIHNTRFIVLDSSRKRGLQKFQYMWLERELQLAKGKRIFLILHRPPVCPKYNYLSFSATTNAKRFLSLMEEYQVEVVFGSHIHVLTEFTRGDVRYVVTGGGGGALWQPSNIHHYLHVFIKEDEVDIKIIELPTPEAKVSQRLKDAIRFNLGFHLNKNKMLKQVGILGTTLLLSRTVQYKKRHRWRRKK